MGSKWIDAKSEERPNFNGSLVVIALWYDYWNYAVGNYNREKDCVVLADGDNTEMFFDEFDAWREIEEPDIKFD